MRFSKMELILIGLTVGLASTPALAALTDEINQTSYQRDFKRLDVDGDGKVNAKEIKKDSLFDFSGFSKADKNHNGSLNEDEYATYKSAVQQKEAKQVASDSAITSKIKSKYLLEKGIKSFKVSVETKDGVVVLSGFVDNEAAKTRAAQIASGVSGVKSVKNALIVKP
ncbi:MAG: BON domain-containing protein [Methylotenera sp.]